MREYQFFFFGSNDENIFVEFIYTHIYIYIYVCVYKDAWTRVYIFPLLNISFLYWIFFILIESFHDLFANNFYIVYVSLDSKHA